MANVDDGILDNGEKFREAFEWDLNKIFSYLARVVNLGEQTGLQLHVLHTNIIMSVQNSIGHPEASLLTGPNGSVEYTWNGPAPNVKVNIPVIELLAAVGIILSETVRISNQDPRTYCLPLVAMYGKWCVTICDGFVTRNTPCSPPTKVAISWIWEGRGHPIEKVFLGCCVGGNPWHYPLPYTDRRRCLVFRKETVFRRIWNFGETVAPLAVKGVRPHWDWGNCAETYCFNLLAATPPSKKKFVFGRALDCLGEFIQLPAYDNGSVQSSERGPCPNCRVAIKALNGSLENYNPSQWAVA